MEVINWYEKTMRQILPIVILYGEESYYRTLCWMGEILR